MRGGTVGSALASATEPSECGCTGLGSTTTWPRVGSRKDSGSSKNAEGGSRKTPLPYRRRVAGREEADLPVVGVLVHRSHVVAPLRTAGTISPRNRTHRRETREPVPHSLPVAEVPEKALPQRTSSLLGATMP